MSVGPPHQSPARAAWRELVGVKQVRRRWPFALRAGICMAAPVLAGWAAGDVAAGLAATLGSFTALYGSGRPYLYRAQELAIIAVSLAVAVAVGVWAAQVPWAGVLAVSVIAMVAVFVCNALAVGPPGAYMIVLASAAGIGIAEVNQNAWYIGILVLAGGAFSWLVHMR
jgi:uncharacterized membrane protein YccC